MTEKSTKFDNKNFRCPLCRKKKEYSVKISVEFPNPLPKKYPNLIRTSPYMWEQQLCHLCVFEIFENVYPNMHDDLRAQIEEHDAEIQDDIKNNRIKCECCNDDVGYHVHGDDFNDETKDELK